MPRSAAFTGDTWRFALASLESGGVPITDTSDGISITVSIFLNGVFFTGATPTYDSTIGEWEFTTDLPGPGSVTVRWAINANGAVKTITQSVDVEAPR